MPSELNDAVWITLMHELQSFIRHNLEQPEIMTELRQWMSPVNTAKFSPKPRLATTQVIRAFELLAPGLMVDFLAENPEILNRLALRQWAAERESLHDELVNISA